MDVPRIWLVRKRTLLYKSENRMKAIVFHNQRVPGQTAPDFLPGLAHLELGDVPVPDLPGD